MLSVIIPTLNVAETLPVQLDALASQVCSHPWELVIVDNGSSDGTLEIAEQRRRKFPSLTLMRESRRGRQHACNTGARRAQGQYLVFVDGDDKVMPGFLEAMARGLEEYGIVGGRLDHVDLNGPDYNGVGQVQTAGLTVGFQFLPYAFGCAMGIRRNVFEKIQGFAEDKYYCEDVDICWRAQLAGHSLGFVPGAVVAYRQRARLGDIYRQHRNYGEARVLLYRDYRRYGMKRRGFSAIASAWLRLLRSAIVLRSREERIRWVRKFARNVGYLRGSMKYRVSCL